MGRRLMTARRLGRPLGPHVGLRLAAREADTSAAWASMATVARLQWTILEPLKLLSRGSVAGMPATETPVEGMPVAGTLLMRAATGPPGSRVLLGSTGRRGSARVPRARRRLQSGQQRGG